MTEKRLSGHMWLSDSFRPGYYGLYVYRANLSEQDKPGPHVWYQRAYMPVGRDPVCSRGTSALRPARRRRWTSAT